MSVRLSFRPPPSKIRKTQPFSSANALVLTAPVLSLFRGGHLEFGESPEECAAREILEETGLHVKNVRFLTATNDVMKKDNKHYITMFMVCERVNEEDEAHVMEPDKCEGWEWSSWEDLLALVRKERNVKEGEVLERTLFLPLLDLAEQRPGVVPSI